MSDIGASISLKMAARDAWTQQAGQSGVPSHEQVSRLICDFGCKQVASIRPLGLSTIGSASVTPSLLPLSLVRFCLVHLLVAQLSQ